MTEEIDELPGVIHKDAIYRLDEFCSRMKLGDWALRKARLKGLKMTTIGRRKYVKGSDVLEFLDSLAAKNGG